MTALIIYPENDSSMEEKISAATEKLRNSNPAHHQEIDDAELFLRAIIEVIYTSGRFFFEGEMPQALQKARKAEGYIEKLVTILKMLEGADELLDIINDSAQYYLADAPIRAAHLPPHARRQVLKDRYEKTRGIDLPPRWGQERDGSTKDFLRQCII
jgi:hypothetical protein